MKPSKQKVLKSVHEFILELVLISNFSSFLRQLKQFDVVAPADSTGQNLKICISEHEKTIKYIILHVVEYKDNGDTLGLAKQSKNIKTIQPPKQIDYVVSDFCFLISADKLLFCSMNGNFRRHLAQLSIILSELFKVNSISTRFNIRNLANANTVRQIMQYGVKEVLVSASITSDDYAKILKKSKMSWLDNVFGNTVTGAGKNNVTRKSETISIKAKATASSMGQREINESAKNFVNSNDKFTIILNDGITKFGPNDLKKQYDIHVAPFGNSYKFSDIKAELISLL